MRNVPAVDATAFTTIGPLRYCQPDAGWLDYAQHCGFVTDTTRPDYLFLYWYCMRFAGRWPFATVIVDADLRCQLSEPFCSLKGCRTVAV